jgi:hypothetical protein
MARQMTVRQRVVAALRRQRVDQVPLTIYPGMVPPGELERSLRLRGLGFAVRVWLFSTETPNCQLERCEYSQDGVRYVRTAIRTPVGEVHATSRPGGAYGTTWAVDHYIKGPDDYRVIEFMVRDTVYQPAYDSFLQTVEDIGEDGYVMGNMGYSPLMEMRVNLLGTERFAFDLYDWPDCFFSLYQALREKQREAYPILAGSPADVVTYCGNCSPEILGRKRFEQYCVPCYNDLGEQLHARGKLLGVHLDANNRLWKEAVAASAIDVVEAFTPAPDTDMSVADARAAWPDKVLWLNFPSSMHIASRERIREQTRELLRQAAPCEGLIVGVTEDIPSWAWRTSLSAICDVLAEETEPQGSE